MGKRRYDCNCGGKYPVYSCPCETGLEDIWEKSHMRLKGKPLIKMLRNWLKDCRKSIKDSKGMLECAQARGEGSPAWSSGIFDRIEYYEKELDKLKKWIKDEKVKESK